MKAGPGLNGLRFFIDCKGKYFTFALHIYTERCLSGRKSTPGKCVYSKRVSRVRIPPSPLIFIPKMTESLFFARKQAFCFKPTSCFIRRFAWFWWVIRWVKLINWLTHQKGFKTLIDSQFKKWTSCQKMAANRYLFNHLVSHYEDNFQCALLFEETKELSDRSYAYLHAHYDWQ